VSALQEAVAATDSARVSVVRGLAAEALPDHGLLEFGAADRALRDRRVVVARALIVANVLLAT
jgi:hypothetical protein